MNLTLTIFIVYAVLIVLVDFLINFSRRTSSQQSFPCAIDESVIINGVVDKKGNVLSWDNKTYPIGTYFQENDNIRVCQCLEKPCIRKCCAESEHFAAYSPNCTRVNETLFLTEELKIYKMDSDSNLTIIGNFSFSQFNVLYGDVCSNKYLLDISLPEDVSYMMNDGRLFISGSYYETNSYCLENFVDEVQTQTVICLDSYQQATEFMLYPFGMLMSLPFLFITFLVYAFLPVLQNLHGKSLMTYVSMLFFGYIFLIIVQTQSSSVSNTFCVCCAFIVQFSFLASFFWLNVMCFDIWWVFSGLRPLRGSVKEREHKKFIIYSVYAWGWALAIFIVTLVMQTVESIPDTYVKPEFGVGKCWFRTDAATFWYFYFPIIILVVLNIIMFVTTAFQIRAHTRETEVLNRGESRRHDENEKQRYNLYLKLFIVMGVNWVMELVSWIVGGEKELWYVTDIANTLQGVLIFLIFVWKRRILRLLNNKLCPKLQLVPMTTSSTRSKVSPSRTTTSSLKQTPSNNINTAPDSVSLKKMNSNV